MMIEFVYLEKMRKLMSTRSTSDFTATKDGFYDLSGVAQGHLAYALHHLPKNMDKQFYQWCVDGYLQIIDYRQADLFYLACQKIIGQKLSKRTKKHARNIAIIAIRQIFIKDMTDKDCAKAMAISRQAYHAFYKAKVDFLFGVIADNLCVADELVKESFYKIV